jgi:biotin synthase
LRHDWTTEEVLELLEAPFLDLVFRAAEVHRAFNSDPRVQLSTLLNVKTGGCPEDCSYCSQSAHHKGVGLKKEPLLETGRVVGAAQRAKRAGATRFCMGAAWRGVREGEEFDRLLEMVREVSALGLETCVTLGMLNEEQARRLKEAGLDAYNHNLDTGPSFYSKIVTTRSYEDRLRTIRNVRKAGITLCCGGIVGLGEAVADRAEMLSILAALDPHPENVPINALVAVPGTPLEDRPPVDPLEIVRTVAVARILMPKSLVRLSAGRASMSREAQLLCLLAGANSFFFGEKLLTADNVGTEADLALLAQAGLGIRPPRPGAGEGESAAEGAAAE